MALHLGSSHSPFTFHHNVRLIELLMLNSKFTSSLEPSLISPHPNYILSPSSVSLSQHHAHGSEHRLPNDAPSAVRLFTECVCVCVCVLCVYCVCVCLQPCRVGSSSASLICSFCSTSTISSDVKGCLGIQDDCKGIEEPPKGQRELTDGKGPCYPVSPHPSWARPQKEGWPAELGSQATRGLCA